MRCLSVLCCILLCGCSFDPLGIRPQHGSTPAVVPATTWEKEAPNKEVYAKTLELVSAATVPDAAKYALKYHGLFAGLAIEVRSDTHVTNGGQVFNLHANSREQFGIPPKVIPAFSDYVMTAMNAAGLVNDNDALTDTARTAVADTYLSISCGCAAAYQKLPKGR